MTTDSRDEAISILAAAGVDPAAVDLLSEVARRQGEPLVSLACQLAAGRPLGQIVGSQRFLGLDILTAPDVLVPRKETELLASTGIEEARNRGGNGAPVRVVDVCCGAGNIAVTVAVNVPTARVWATDLAASAVNLTRRNVEQQRLGSRVTVLQGDLMAPLAELELQGSIDVVICNPPYISTSRLGQDRAGLVAFEPVEAFDGGPFGFAIHQRLTREAATYLKPGGALLMEVGAGQARQVGLLLARAGQWTNATFRADERGTPRVALAFRTGGPVR